MIIVAILKGGLTLQKLHTMCTSALTAHLVNPAGELCLLLQTCQGHTCLIPPAEWDLSKTSLNLYGSPALQSSCGLHWGQCSCSMCSPSNLIVSVWLPAFVLRLISSFMLGFWLCCALRLSKSHQWCPPCIGAEGLWSHAICEVTSCWCHWDVVAWASW